MTNIMRVALEPAFVLHSRAYRNSSLIVELLSRRYGRIAVVARSARGPRSRYQGKLQLFLPLLVSWSGRSDLKSLGNIELSGMGYELDGRALLCGFYLNELLMRLLKHEDPYPIIYQRYQDVLNRLESSGSFEADLRYFEKQLLKELGYGIPLAHEVVSGDVIDQNAFYRYMPERGFALTDPSDDRFIFPGYVLQALDNECLETKDELKFAKRLMRMVMARHLGQTPIHTRELL
ncbi:MAG: DNA repair protein RecO [Coxiella sp. (in: Bacteria)]|nr:MAG: DNA repair protein RecO [Coxiella sp. (in: g-proteobacteria)]